MPARVMYSIPKGSVRALAQLAGGRHGHRHRPRTQGDRAIISRMALVEIKRRIVDGRLVRLGPREYELHLRQR